MHLNVKLSSEAELKQLLDFLYEKAKQNATFTGLMEAIASGGYNNNRNPQH